MPHQYRSLIPDELTAVLTRHLSAGTTTDDAIAHAAAIAAIVRITGGNFRLVDRFLTQIERVQSLNKLEMLTPEIVGAAREALLIGH
jgi:hypothetical protein